MTLASLLAWLPVPVWLVGSTWPNIWSNMRRAALRCQYPVTATVRPASNSHILMVSSKISSSVIGTMKISQEAVRGKCLNAIKSSADCCPVCKSHSPKSKVSSSVKLTKCHPSIKLPLTYPSPPLVPGAGRH